MVDEIARQHAGRLLVLKLNSDQHPETSAKHGVQGIPTFLLFRNGLEIARQVGLPGREALQRWVLQEVRADGQSTCPISGNSKSPQVRRR